MIELRNIEVVASNGDGIGGNIDQGLKDYAVALTQRAPTQVAFMGSPFLDNLAIEAAFLLKVSGSGGLEQDVVREPEAIGHDVDPDDPSQWTSPASRVGVVHAVTGLGFLGVRYDV